MSKVKAIMECWQKSACTCMYLMVTIALRISVNEILSHFIYPRSLLD